MARESVESTFHADTVSLLSLDQMDLRRDETRRLLGQCKTKRDFMLLGQRLGYKKGWAHYKYRELMHDKQ